MAIINNNIFKLSCSVFGKRFPGCRFLCQLLSFSVPRKLVFSGSCAREGQSSWLLRISWYFPKQPLPASGGEIVFHGPSRVQNGQRKAPKQQYPTKAGNTPPRMGDGSWILKRGLQLRPCPTSPHMEKSPYGEGRR